MIPGLLTKGTQLAKDHGIENPNENRLLTMVFLLQQKPSPRDRRNLEEIESLVRIALYNEQNTCLCCDPEVANSG